MSRTHRNVESRERRHPLGAKFASKHSHESQLNQLQYPRHPTFRRSYLI